MNEESESMKMFVTSFPGQEEFETYLELLANFIKNEKNSSRPEFSPGKIHLLSRFYINGLHAARGYIFKSSAWQRLFDEFPWYSGSTGTPVIPEKNRETLEEIIKIRDTILSG